MDDQISLAEGSAKAHGRVGLWEARKHWRVATRPQSGTGYHGRYPGRFFYVQDERYFAVEHREVRREASQSRTTQRRARPSNLQRIGSSQQNSSTCNRPRSLSGQNYTKKSTPLKFTKNWFFTTEFKYVQQTAKPLRPELHKEEHAPQIYKEPVLHNIGTVIPVQKVTVRVRA